MDAMRSMCLSPSAWWKWQARSFNPLRLPTRACRLLVPVLKPVSTSAQRQFIQMVDAGITPPPELLRAIADRLKKDGAPRKDGRNECIAAAFVLLCGQGMKKTHARNHVFSYYDGPEDDRERRKIIKKNPCFPLVAISRAEQTELLWSPDDKAFLNMQLKMDRTGGARLHFFGVGSDAGTKPDVFFSVIPADVLDVDGPYFLKSPRERCK
jgi:hypothetical protein